MSENKVSMKTPSIVEGSKQISNGLKTMRTSIENMPECGVKKSLMVTQETYEKKINAIVKREQIASALAAIRKNPSLLDNLPDDVKASFASNDDEAVKVVKNESTSGKRKH